MVIFGIGVIAVMLTVMVWLALREPDRDRDYN